MLVAPYIERYPEIFEDSWYVANSLETVKSVLADASLDKHYLCGTMNDYMDFDIGISLVYHRDFVDIFALFANMKFRGKEECFEELLESMFRNDSFVPLLKKPASTLNHLDLLKLLCEKKLVDINSVNLAGVLVLSAYLDDSAGLLEYVLGQLSPETRAAAIKNLAIALGYHAPQAVPLALAKGAAYDSGEAHSLVGTALHAVMYYNAVPVELIRQVIQYRTGKVPDLPKLFYLHTYLMFSDDPPSDEYLTDLESVIPLLIEKGDKPDSRLWVDCFYFRNDEKYKRNHRLIKILQDHAVGINDYDSDGRTVFFHTARGEQLQALIDEGADIRLANRDGKTIFFYQTRYGNYSELYEFGSKYGVDINAQDSEGNTALGYALMAGNYRWAELLACSETDATIRNNREETAADIFSRNIHQLLNESGVETKKTLLDIYTRCQGDMYVRDGRNCSFMDYAHQSKDVAYARLLIKYGFDLERVKLKLPAAFMEAINRTRIDTALTFDDSEYYRAVVNINLPLNEENLSQAVSLLNALFSDRKQDLFPKQIYQSAYIQFALHDSGVFSSYLDQAGFYRELLKHANLANELVKLANHVRDLERDVGQQVWGDDEVCFLQRIYFALALHRAEYIPLYADYLTYVDDHSVIEGEIEQITEKYGYTDPVVQLLAVTALASNNQHGMETFQLIAEESFTDYIKSNPATAEQFYGQLFQVAQKYDRREAADFQEIFTVLYEDEKHIERWLERAKSEIGLES